MTHTPAKDNGFKIPGKGGLPISVDPGLKEIEHLTTALLHTKGNPTGVLEQRKLWTEDGKQVLKFRYRALGNSVGYRRKDWRR